MAFMSGKPAEAAKSIDAAVRTLGRVTAFVHEASPDPDKVESACEHLEVAVSLLREAKGSMREWKSDHRAAMREKESRARAAAPVAPKAPAAIRASDDDEASVTWGGTRYVVPSGADIVIDGISLYANGVFIGSKGPLGGSVSMTGTMGNVRIGSIRA